MMDRLEKSSGQTVVTLAEAKALLKEDDELTIAVFDYWLNKRLKTVSFSESKEWNYQKVWCSSKLNFNSVSSASKTKKKCIFFLFRSFPCLGKLRTLFLWIYWNFKVKNIAELYYTKSNMCSFSVNFNTLFLTNHKLTKSAVIYTC